jgi:cytochrome c5
MVKLKFPFLAITMLVASGFLGWQLGVKHFHTVVEQESETVWVTEEVSPRYHSPAIFVKSIEGKPEQGAYIYDAFCSACHANPPDIMLQAPRISESQVWRGLLSQGKSKLLQSTIQGLGAMPARGGCFECSDAQLQAAIDYMLENALGAQ